MISNIESYYKPLTSTILALFIVSIRKVVNSSLKNQNVRTRKSELFD